MTNFDITSFFKRTSEKSLVSQPTAASGGVAPPPGLGGGGPPNGGGAGVSIGLSPPSVTSSSSVGGIASLLPAHAHHLSYDTDSLWSDAKSSNLVSQPHTTPIAHVVSTLPPPIASSISDNTLVQNSSKPLASGARLIDWNDSFLVYVVKGGLIRVIDRRTGLRTLLRGHSVKGQTSYVRDMVFFSRSSDILATVGTLPNASDGPPQTGVLIWRIYNSHPGGEVLQDCLLELRCFTEAEATHMAWHPFNTNVFVVAHGSKVTVVESTKLKTAPSLMSPAAVATGTRPHASCYLAGSGSDGGPVDNNYTGQVVLEDHTDSILDVSWSIANPRFLFTCGLDGTVRAWDVRDIEEGPAGGAPAGKCLWTLFSTGSVGTRCLSLPASRPSNAPPGVQPQSVGGLEPFLVASQSNGEDGTAATSLTLYSSTADPTVKPHATHVLDLTHSVSAGDTSAGPSYCVSICHPPTMGQNSGKPSDKGVYILVSRLNEGTSSGTQSPLMLVLHALATTTGNSQSYKFVKVTPYSLLYPLLSWSTGFSMRVDDNDDEEDDDVQQQQQNGGSESNKAKDDGSQWDITAFVVQTKAVQTLCVRPGPPSSSAGTEAGRGVTVISMKGPHSSMQPSATTAALPPAVVQEVETYDMHDDGGEDHYDDNEDDDDDHHELHDEDDENDGVLAPATAGGEVATPFANWLGALAQSAPEPVPPTKPAPAPQLKHIPTPPAGPPVFDEVLTTTSTTTVSTASSKLLTPTEIMSGKGKQAEDVVKSQPSKSKTKNNPKSKSPRPSRSRTPTNSKGAADANGSINMGKNKKGSIDSFVTSAQAPGQVKILKRTDSPVAPKTLPATLPAVPAAPSTIAVVNKSVPGITAKEMEESVARAMASFAADQSRLMQKTLQEDMCPKLISAMDANNKEQAPQMSQTVSTQVSVNIKEPVTEAFHSCMREVMIPAFEAASQQMFQQVSIAVEAHLGVLQQQVRQDETASRQMVEMASVMSKLVHTVESLSVEVSQLRKQVADSSVASAAAPLSVPPGVSAPPGMGGPPRQQPPAVDPFAGLRQEMLMFLNAQNYEAAFTNALSSNNAELTKFCCRNADLSLVLGGSEGGAVLLSQPILLCIVQQLGSTLATSPLHAADVKMELEWMQEIALSLKASDPTIRQHVPQVMSQLDGNIQTKLNQGDPALRRPLQMLLQVLRGISH